jgi:uncharacterized protein
LICAGTPGKYQESSRAALTETRKRAQPFRKEAMEEKIVVSGCGQKLVLAYPCPWVYKLIGPEQEGIRGAIAAVLQERQCLVTLSSSSRTGKYHCLNVEVVVQDEADRTTQYEAFRRHPAIVMVL